MIDFKPIEEFTFDDCVNSIERHKNEGMPIDVELQTRYEHLLSSLNNKEKLDYSSCKTIQSLEKYIKKYTSLSGAMNYRPQYIQQAKDEILRLTIIRKKKQQLKKISIIALIIVFIGIIIFFGYRPVKDISIYTNMSFNAISASKNLELPNDNDDYWMLESTTCDWISVKKNGNIINISVSQNNGDSRYCYIEIYSYNHLFGIPLNKVTKKVNVTQLSGRASFLNISKNSIYIDKLGTSSTLNYNFTISTDGVEIIDPVLDTDPWIEYEKSVISESPLEIMYTLKIDKNPSSERTLTLEFSSLDGLFTQSISIVQESGVATYFILNDNELYVRKDALPEGKCYAVDIDTDGTSWSVSSCPQWIKYKIIGNRLKIFPETWIKDDSHGIQIGRFGDIILISNNPELKPITISVSQGLLG